MMRTSTATGRGLQGAKQLDLESRRGLADFVQEQRAAIGLLKQPDAVLGGARKCTALVAEKLAFEQGVGQRAAVFHDK